MNKKTALQSAMFAEMEEKTLFQKAEAYAFDYLNQVADRNIFPTEQALSDLDNFDEPMPEQTGNSDEIIDLLQRYGAPATVPYNGRYFGFVNGSMIPTALAAKNMSIFWDQNAALQVMSPITAKLEIVVQNWLVELFGLPKNTVAGFVSGTSMANFSALAAARFRLLKNQGWDVTEQGLFGAPKIRVVTGKHIHSSILKAISLAGFGKGNIEWVDCDDQGRIIPERIPELDEQTLLILQAGNVNSGAFDNFAAICRKAKEQGAWIHIDGAFGLWAGATERLRHLMAGLEFATSYAVDGHKTLNTPYDSGIIMCQDEEALVSALHTSASYLESTNQREGMYYTPEMSKRARVIELWATLKYLGKTGIDSMIYEMHERAKQFAVELSKLDGFEVLNEVVFNQVIVRCATDELTQRVMEKMQALRTCWAGGSVWEGHKVIRISVCSWATTEADVQQSVASFAEAYRLVQPSLV
ncbi:MAG: aminotransferase class V-fold PLP-dependent enzyme [Bacteroidota bacterium]